MSYTTFGKHEEISIREATGDDHAALRRLAQRDSASVPEGAVLIAAIDGETRAAISLADATQAIADPFHPTERLLTMLRFAAAERTDDRSHRPTIGSLRVSRRRTALRSAVAWR